MTSFAIVGAPALLASASSPVFPIACKVTANVTFSPALTKTGMHTTNSAAVTTMTVTGGHLSECLSAAPESPNKGTLPTMTARIPATNLGRISGVRMFETGDCPTFMQSGSLKVLRTLRFDVAWSGGQVAE